uniref:Proteasome subunit alpha type n=1 Tax=Spongospora subterranea TaxID=70186 RepID=A0A0H5R568_9EUKA|eukprot:CRZ08952.1 hypothetical protein [Spongospora subterranea]
MFLTRSDYDQGVNTFSPEGRLFQVEYAMEAIKLGSTAIGIQVKDGVVLAVEKRVSSKLLEPSSIQKIVEIDHHIGTAISGLTADARTLIEHARIQSQNHWFAYNEKLRVKSCAQSVCDLALGFGEGNGGMSRPFGVAMLIAGVDVDGPVLFHSDPSGTYTKYKAKAIGAASEGAQTTLQEEYNPTMTLAEAEKLALTILKQVMEEKISDVNVELAVVSAATGLFTIHTPDQLTGVISQLSDSII